MQLFDRKWQFATFFLFVYINMICRATIMSLGKMILCLNYKRCFAQTKQKMVSYETGDK